MCLDLGFRVMAGCPVSRWTRTDGTRECRQLARLPGFERKLYTRVQPHRVTVARGFVPLDSEAAGSREVQGRPDVADRSSSNRACDASQQTGVPSSGAEAGDWRHKLFSLTSSSPHDLELLSFKGTVSPSLPWRAVTVRPVHLQQRASGGAGGNGSSSSRLHLQFSYFDMRQNTTKNEPAGSEAAAGRLRELLLQDLPFTSVSMRSHSEASGDGGCLVGVRSLSMQEVRCPK
jgi:hypothetical protein